MEGLSAMIDKLQETIFCGKIKNRENTDACRWMIFIFFLPDERRKRKGELYYIASSEDFSRLRVFRSKTGFVILPKLAPVVKAISGILFLRYCKRPAQTIYDCEFKLCVAYSDFFQQIIR
jgi:hypothetical protein